MANYVEVTLPEIDAFLVPLRFQRNNNLTYRGRPIKEIVYERTLPGKPNHIVRVYTTINRFGQKRGRGRKVGKDAIRVQVLYQDDQGEVLLYQPKRVHRVANWETNLQNRLDEIISADINVVRDKRGQPMTLRTKGANKFWGSRDYPAYKETRRYGSEQVTKIDTPDNWVLVTIADIQTNSFGKGLQRQFNFSDYDGKSYDAVWELIEIIDDFNNKLKHTAHTQFSYDRVLITLYTDDVGNLTQKDFIWAEEFNDFYDYDELIMMSESKRESKRVIVINSLGGKLHSLVKWSYYPDGSKKYETIKTPKPIRYETDPRQIQRFYTALGVSSQIYDMERQKFNSESYPTCYLCGLPAKIEVLTAVGMRNFCSNKCRGDYEGVDYGDYDSPKLEHQLTITNYDQGYLPDGYRGRESKLTIDCANCPVHLVENIPEYVDIYSDYSTSKRHIIKIWNEEWEDYDEEPCIKHDFEITRYLSNSDEWDGVRLGEVAFRCVKCGYRDMIYADIPEGCSNKGRVKPTMFQIMGNNQTDRMRLP